MRRASESHDKTLRGKGGGPSQIGCFKCRKPAETRKRREGTQLIQSALDPQKELFTLADVAIMLALSERTVESLVARGHLRSAIAPGTDRSRRVSREMIDEYLERFNS